MITRRALIEGAAAAGAAWLVWDGLAQSAETVPAHTAEMQPWNVRRFGAKGDGQALDTAAVRAAIDSCHTAGGGAVLFFGPLMWPIRLQPILIRCSVARKLIIVSSHPTKCPESPGGCRSMRIQGVLCAAMFWKSLALKRTEAITRASSFWVSNCSISFLSSSGGFFRGSNNQKVAFLAQRHG